VITGTGDGGPTRSADRAIRKIPTTSRLPEIVRMAGGAPQPGGHDLALVIRILLELHELGVADRFEEKPDQPDRRSARSRAPRARGPTRSQA